MTFQQADNKHLKFFFNQILAKVFTDTNFSLLDLILY